MKRMFENVIPPSGGVRFPALDGLRGLAAVAVLLHHTPLIHHTIFGHQGNNAVSTFFALSAFLLYYPWVAGKAPAAGKYYLRRALRIYPAYGFALVLAVIIGFVLSRPAKLPDIFAHLLFIHSLIPAYRDSIISPAWSLATEVHFYLLLPLFALLLKKRETILLPLLVLAGIYAQYAVSPASLLWTDWPPLALPFFCGLVAAFLVNRKPRACKYLALLGLPLILLAREFPLTAIGAPLMNTKIGFLLLNPRGTLPSLAAAAAIAGLAGNQKGILHGIFASAPLRFLGFCGYGIFLLHKSFFDFTARLMPDLLVIFVAIPLTIFVAYISYVQIEAPMIKLSHRLNLTWPRFRPSSPPAR
jgi:peptidoglycan/LPS O-acetylase OafA/YrhL